MLLPSAFRKLVGPTSRGAVLSVYKSGPGTQSLLASQMLERGRSVVAVLPDESSLKEFRSLVRLLHPADANRAFWDRQWIGLEGYDPEQKAGSWAARWASLFALKEGRKPLGVMLTLDNLLPLWPQPEVLDREYEFLMPGETISPQQIVDSCIAWGYERVSMTTRLGELSLRGDILDVFAPGYEAPLRLEFFGDTLESIRLFEPLSQRSKEQLEEAVLLPVAPAVCTDENLSRAKEHWAHLWKTGLLSKAAKASLEQRVLEGDTSFYPGLFYPKPVPLSSWLPKDAVYFLVEASSMRSRLDELAGRWKKHFQAEAAANGWSWPEESIVQTKARARRTWLEADQVLFEELPVGDRSRGTTLSEQRYSSFADLFWNPEQRKRPWSALMQALQEWKRTQNQVILSFHSENARRRFFKLTENVDLEFKTVYSPQEKGIFALLSDFSGGLELDWSHVLILSEEVLQPSRENKAVKRAADKDFKGLKRFEDIQADDLIVHRDYGLGQYAGLTRLQVDDTGNDYLVLLYAGGDKLYVPVDRLNLIQKYKGPEGGTPALDRLGSTQWSKTKERVRKALETIAHDLVQMYAYRKVTKGYAYPKADDLFQEFEATFDFEETPDQEEAIGKVLEDMESQMPMDRLICGDAGFGKTEVAMRAAFWAVAAGKQVALLCPTTVLAEQHYQNFKGRMEDFSVNVAMLSRFVPASKQKQVLKAAERGEIDILIGTHRLLSKDVQLPRMSLFILDEEQRFGVRHKEALKKIRQNIDVLTLTATPIPRTLQMSLSGLRQLSVIETPPHDRKAVESSLIERSPEELRAIVQRELDRGGQVFWVYNRVKGLTRIKEFVQTLVPEARVAMAHGQMSERSLEETMRLFWKGEVDVLVTTAIIESGLDFPRANTLVVDQAQMFGLGQLYQLRGRVGRSHEQAYAYFVVPSLDNLSGMAAKRLRTILDMDYLGAGFQVAMEDLRLRGAGNILGESQSGNISKVGLDLFLEMLEQEVRKVQGQTQSQETEPELNITFEANIPSEYIQDAQERLHYYKGISSAASRQDLEEWAEEMKDRFGPLPEPVHNLLAVIHLKRRLAKLQAERADLFANRVVVSWPSGVQPVDPDRLVAWMERYQDAVKLDPPAKLELRFDPKTSISRAIYQTEERLGELASTEYEEARSLSA